MVEAERTEVTVHSDFELIPRAFVDDWLTRSVARPLEPQLRGFMEARFGVDFGDVRIHTGARAAALCEAVQARALTLGRHIVFGAGQYAPATPDGRLLLAHELVHVLQQRAAPRGAQPCLPSSLIAVGPALDACEDEADALAAEALGAGLRSSVRADRSGANRRAAVVMDGTATLTTSHEGATPGIDYTERGPARTPMALLHLSRNKQHVVRAAEGSTSIRTSQTAAIRLTGTVLIQASPKATKEEINRDWSCHLIQFFLGFTNKASYAGKMPAEGSMVLDFYGQTYFRGHGKYLFDARPEIIPFVETYSGVHPVNPPTGLWKATVLVDDHPLTLLPLAHPNHAAGDKMNYLYGWESYFAVVTVLVKIDVKTRTAEPLMHVEWGAMSKARLHWHTHSDGAPVVDAAVMDISKFWADRPVRGAPPSGLSEMIKQHDGVTERDLFNSAAGDAMKSVLGNRVTNHEIDARAGWVSSVPGDHFK